MPFNRLQALVNCLIDDIERGAWPEGRLPPVRALALEYGTSAVTALRALDKLRARGLIALCSNRRGYLITGAPDPTLKQTSQRAALPSYVRIADSVRKEILLSPAWDAPLPPLAAFQQRFRCSHATVRAAMRVLESEGLIERSGRSYLQSKKQVHDPISSRVYFTGTASVLDEYWGHVLPLLLSLDRELAGADWGQLQLQFSADPRTTSTPQEHLVSAFVHVSHAADAPWRRFFYLRPNIPLVLIDPPDRSLWRLPAHKRFFRIVPDNLRAGREMGLLLSSLHHTRIAFFTHVPIEYGWSLQRLRGLSQVYRREAVGGDALVVLDGSGGSSPEHGDGAGNSAGAAVTVVVEADGIVPEIVAQVTRSVALLEQSEAVAAAMRPLFTRALADHTITAWVCINDMLAAAALHFLRRSDSQLAGRISVAGFDNSPLAYRMGLTSYDFAFDKMGHLAAQLLLHPDSVPPDEARHVRVAGRVVVRQSTGTMQRETQLTTRSR